MLIMEIKFSQLLFTIQKRTIGCNLEIANIWIEDYKRFPSSMLAMRRTIAVFVLVCWKTSKKLLLTFERKKSGTSTVLYLKMLKSHNAAAHDYTHVQLLIEKLKVLLKSLFMNISRSVATIRRTSRIRFK